MKVSVVVTTYNRACYVLNAVDSVLRQTLKDLELIVVDDGSTDDTELVLSSYHDRIRYVRTENRGPAHARNVGIGLATGDYVCLLDSDDVSHPARLALQSAVLDDYPDIDIVCTECSAFDDHGLRQEFHLQDYHEPAYGRGGVTYRNLFQEAAPIESISGGTVALLAEPTWQGRQLYIGRIFDSYLIHIVIIAVSIMFRRSLTETTGMQNPRFGFFHDLEFALRLCRDRRVAFLDVPVYRIRYHSGQISTTVGTRAPWIMIRKQQDLLRVLRVHGVRDRTYYQFHRGVIDRQVARLCRAVAVPLLGYDRGSQHQRKYFPRRARTYLQRAARSGYPQRLLWLSSFAPSTIRRVLMKLERMADLILQRWAARARG